MSVIAFLNASTAPDESLRQPVSITHWYIKAFDKAGFTIAATAVTVPGLRMAVPRFRCEGWIGFLLTACLYAGREGTGFGRLF